MIRGKIRFDSIYVRERSDAVGFAVPRVEEVAGRPLKYSMFVLVDILFRRWMKWMDPSNQARFALIGQVHLEYCSGTVCHSDCSGSRHWRCSLWCTLLGKSFQDPFVNVPDCAVHSSLGLRKVYPDLNFSSCLRVCFPAFFDIGVRLSLLPVRYWEKAYKYPSQYRT